MPSTKQTTLMLDTIPNVQFAYSMWKLRTAYTGNCVRLRRSSDQAEQDFGFVNNKVDIAGIATFLGANTGYVTKYWNQGLIGGFATNPTANRQPTFVVVSGVPRIRCVNQCVYQEVPSPSTLFTTSYHIFTTVSVNAFDGTSNSRIMDIDTAGDPGYGIHMPYNYQYGGSTICSINGNWGVDTVSVPTAMDLNTIYTITGSRNSNIKMEARRNSSEVGKKTSGLTNGVITYSNATVYIAIGYNNPTNHDNMASIACNSFLTDAQQAFVEKNLIYNIK